MAASDGVPRLRLRLRYAIAVPGKPRCTVEMVREIATPVPWCSEWPEREAARREMLAAMRADHDRHGLRVVRYDREEELVWAG